MFDFNATPLVPPVIKCLLHGKPVSRGSWEVRAINGWYVNRAKNHYRCYQVIPGETQEVKDIRHSGIKFGRLDQGFGTRIKVINTLEFTPKR